MEFPENYQDQLSLIEQARDDWLKSEVFDRKATVLRLN